MWNVKSARDGESYEWHKINSRDTIFGYMAMKTTAHVTGMGSAERAWAVSKGIKNDKRAHISSNKLEKLTIIQSTHWLEEARRGREAMEKLDFQGKGALWGDEDERFDLGLTKFGVDICALQEVPSAHRRVFRCWLEDWEKEAIKTPGAVAKTKLLEKQRGLVFEWIDEPVTIFTSSDDMKWRSGRVNGG